MTNVLSANFSYFEDEQGQNKKITLAELALIRVIENGSLIKGDFSFENVDKLGIHHLFKMIRASNKMFYREKGLSKDEIEDVVEEENQVVIDLLIKYMLPLIRYRLSNDEVFVNVLLQTNLKKLPFDREDVVEIINVYLLEIVQKQLRIAVKRKASVNKMWISDFIYSFMIFLSNVKTFIEHKTGRKFDLKVGFVKRVLQLMFPLNDVVILKVEPVPDYVGQITGDREVAALLWEYLSMYVENTDETHALSSIDFDVLVTTTGNEVIAKSPIIIQPTNGFAPVTNKDIIRIYTLEGCPACIDAKKLIAKKGLVVTELTVTDENQNEIFSKIDVETKKQRGFPIIFINEKYIGGLDSLEQRLK
jgi:glutaredoxin